jgi:hypothetical protein
VLVFFKINKTITYKRHEVKLNNCWENLTNQKNKFG